MGSLSSHDLGLVTGGTEAVRITTGGNVGIGTSSPTALRTKNLEVSSSGTNDSAAVIVNKRGTGIATMRLATVGGADGFDINYNFPLTGGLSFTDLAASATRVSIDSSGNLLVGTTTASVADANGVGASFSTIGNAQFSRASGGVVNVNRKTDDGVLVYFQQDATSEGNISVSGTTVSYNGGHLSRYAQTTTVKDNSLLKGTVLSNLDAMNVYTDAEGTPVANEQLNKVKVSSVEGDANVAGVFVNWTLDEQHNVDEINMAMTGDMIIRIAQGTTVQRGDLLMSAGDGTAKPQGDDIVRSKTVAKVTSTHVTCTYADGSYCVPCVLMAC